MKKADTYFGLTWKKALIEVLYEWNIIKFSTISVLADCLPQLVLCCPGKVSQLATLPITSIAIHCVGQLTKRTMGVWTEEYGTYNETASTLTSASSYSQVLHI